MKFEDVKNQTPGISGIYYPSYFYGPSIIVRGPHSESLFNHLFMGSKEREVTLLRHYTRRQRVSRRPFWLEQTGVVNWSNNSVENHWKKKRERMTSWDYENLHRNVYSMNIGLGTESRTKLPLCFNSFLRCSPSFKFCPPSIEILYVHPNLNSV